MTIPECLDQFSLCLSLAFCRYFGKYISCSNSTENANMWTILNSSNSGHNSSSSSNNNNNNDNNKVSYQLLH